MKRWDQRPIEIRYLFNPAFCGLLLHRALAAYQDEDARGMPFSLAFLLLPLCMHKDSRDIITKNTKRYLLKVAGGHPEMQVGFAERANSMLPYTLEGFGLLMERECIAIDESGHIQAIPGTVNKSITGTTETRSCQRAARYLGKHFARIGDRATVYATFGVRP